MTSVVIAAHDEAAVIGGTLDALRSQSADLQIVVVANACSDDTAAVARARGAEVVELTEPGKAGALNVGDRLGTRFPRIFLDADIGLPAGSLAAFEAALAERGGPLVVAPARRLSARGRPWVVRAYSAISSRLPAYREGLFGRGVVALSEAGRARFDEFPALVADDLFLDGLYTADERRILPSVTVVVEAPWTTADLMRRLVRVRRANAELRAAARTEALTIHVRPSDRWAWLRDVVRPQPWLLPAGVVYTIVTVIAARRARRGPSSGAWERDESTRHGELDERAASAR